MWKTPQYQKYTTACGQACPCTSAIKCKLAFFLFATSYWQIIIRNVLQWPLCLLFSPASFSKLWLCYDNFQKEILIARDHPARLKGQVKTNKNIYYSTIMLVYACILTAARRNHFIIIVFKGMFSWILGATCTKWPLENSQLQHA